MIQYISPAGVADAWVVNELEVVDAEGVPFQLHGLRQNRSSYHTSEWGQRLGSLSQSIYPLRFPDFVAIAAAPFRFRGRFFSALWNALTGERESLRVRLTCFLHLLVACAWATQLQKQQTSVSHIHAQWIHASGSVGMYGAWLLGVPFSFTGHAADIYRERVALRDKIRRAAFIVCISSHHEQFFLENGACPEQLRRVYCGIDVTKFSPQQLQPVTERLRIRSAGRLVEKKGFEYLIEACAFLRDEDVPFECVIGGSGPLEDALRQKVRDLKLEDCVELTGQQLKQELIPEFMHSGNVFCLACVWAADNDVDGLPQMLMEAMACGLPAVSTRLVGIPDLVIDEQTGLLAEPRDARGLADTLARLRDQTLADRLAAAGREHVVQQFEIHTALQPLIAEYRAILNLPANAAGTADSVAPSRATIA